MGTCHTFYKVCRRAECTGFTSLHGAARAAQAVVHKQDIFAAADGKLFAAAAPVFAAMSAAPVFAAGARAHACVGHSCGARGVT